MRLIFSLATAVLLVAPTVNAAVIYADEILDYHHSGSEVFDAGYGYGGPPDGSSVPLTNATDQNPNTYISLPTGSYITLGFSEGYVFDGSGYDLFIDEIGAGSEKADLFVSSDYGQSFEFLTKLDGARTNNIDFSDYGYAGRVNAIKLAGLDKGGTSPGFDVTSVWGLEGSVTPVPLPAGLPMLIGGLGVLGWAARKGRARKGLKRQ